MSQVVINAKLICKVVLEEDDIQEEMTENPSLTREDIIYRLSIEDLDEDVNIKDAEFTELSPS